MNVSVDIVLFDCDSTLSAIEGIDELGRGHPEIAALTTAAMDGTVPIDAVYARRLDIIRPSRSAIAAVGALYVARLVADARAVVAALQAAGKEVHIISGGLKPAVMAVAVALGFPAACVHAVDVRFDAAGAYAGFDTASPLTRADGKVVLVRALTAATSTTPARRAVLVGDGATDLAAAPALALFIGFGGVVARPAVRAHAPAFITAPSLAPVLALALTPDEQSTLRRDARFTAVMQRASALNPDTELRES